MKLLFLGGVGEFGENLTCLEDDNTGVIIDCGSKFGSLEYPGVNYFYPDLDYIKNNEKYKHIIITHGHLDHIGAVIKIIQCMDINVIASKFVINLLKDKIKYSKKIIKQINFIEINDEEQISVGNFNIKFYENNHSILQSFSMRIENKDISLFHTGDFKLSDSSVSKKYIKHLKKMKKTDILLLDSTNSNKNNINLSEKNVKNALFEKISKVKKNTFITLFSSNIERIENIAEIGKKLNRKVVLLGRSMQNYIDVAKKSNFNFNYNLLSDSAYKSLEKNEDDKFIFLVSGSQGNITSALTSLSSHSYKKIEIERGDTFIYSAKIIPGNEKNVYRIFSRLVKKGVKIIDSKNNPMIHASGHADKNSIKKLIKIISPNFYIPIHGEYYQQLSNKNLALTLGYSDKNIIIPELGDIYELKKNNIDFIDRLESNIKYDDITGIDDMEFSLIRERNKIKLGIIVIFLIIDKENNKLALKPNIVVQGFVDDKTKKILIDNIINLIEKSAQEINLINEEYLLEHFYKITKKYIKNSFNHSPKILVKIDFFT